MLAAFWASGVFLVSYLIRFATTGAHKYPGAGWDKTLYLVVLFSHMVLAVVLVSLLLGALKKAADAPRLTTAMTLATRLDWATLLRRVWGADVTACPRCAQPLTILAFITKPDVTAAILDHLSLAFTPLTIAPARAPPGDTLDLHL